MGRWDVKFGIGVFEGSMVLLIARGLVGGPEEGSRLNTGVISSGEVNRPLGTPVGEGRSEMGEGSEPAPDAPEAPVFRPVRHRCEV